MTTFTVEHKHCKATTTIEGYTIYDAMRENGLDAKVWTVIATEENN
jgi:hypothetical protein